MTNTNEITLSTPVSVCIGSDQYAARIVKLTKKTITVEDGDETRTFRLNKWGQWKSGSFRLHFGSSVTRLDMDR